ncbi:MAG: inositol oxygenase family protein, partial [Planctomycetota bacterium]
MTRRLLLGALGTGVVGGAAGLAGGLAAGYRFRTELRDVKLRMLAPGFSMPAEIGAFRREARRIFARHGAQTAETVAALKRKYRGEVFGRIHVWDLVQKLAYCIDPTDMRLFCGSQLVHAHQVVAAMEANGVDDRDMLLLGLIHDLGKVLLLRGEAPENVVCSSRRISGGEPGAGLDRAVFQYCHPEFVYSRIVDHVPPHVAWVARYHNIDIEDCRPFMTEQEREWSRRYLEPFQHFDGDFVSPYYIPRIDEE